MQLKDATRYFGRLGLLLPLILIFLIAADSAYACPEHTSRVAYRTKAIKTRTASYMPSTVITYRAPASYRRCGANMYDTRGAKYVAVRRNGHHSTVKRVAVRSNGTRYVAIRGSGARYVAVLDDDDLYKPKLRRYGAVHDVDYGEAPRRFRTVAVRRPVYVEQDTRYVMVRRVEPRTKYVAVRMVEPRTRYVAVRHVDIDDDDEPRYVAVRRHDPGVRYVAVRTSPRTRYVAVNNIESGCTRAVALRRCLDDVETTSVKRVVLRNDDVSTKHVVLRDDLDDDDVAYINDVYNDDDDDDYVTVAEHQYVAEVDDTPMHVEYSDATYSKLNRATYIAANDLGDTCLRNVAVRTCHPDAVSTRTITYEVDDDDLDDQAFLHDDDDVTYVAVNDMEDACMPRQVVYTSPALVTTEAVSYVPADDVVDDTSLVGSEAAFIETENIASQPRYVALDDDRVFDDLDPTWVEEVGEETAAAFGYVPAGEVATLEAEPVSYVPAEEVETIEAEPVSYVPAEETETIVTEPVGYMPADEVEVSAEPVSSVPVEELDVTPVTYTPVEDVHAETVSYVPVESVNDLDTTYVVAEDCPELISSVESEPIYVADDSTALVAEVDGGVAADLGSTDPIDGEFSYRDEFEDAEDAPLVTDVY